MDITQYQKFAEDLVRENAVAIAQLQFHVNLQHRLPGNITAAIPNWDDFMKDTQHRMFTLGMMATLFTLEMNNGQKPLAMPTEFVDDKAFMGVKQ